MYIKYKWKSIISKNNILSDKKVDKDNLERHIQYEKIAWNIYKFFISRFNDDAKEIIEELYNNAFKKHNIENADISLDDKSLEEIVKNNACYPQLESNVVCFKISSQLLSDFGILKQNDNVIINKNGIFIIRSANGRHQISNLILKKATFYVKDKKFENFERIDNDLINKVFDSLYDINNENNNENKSKNIKYDILKELYTNQNLLSTNELETQTEAREATQTEAREATQTEAREDKLINTIEISENKLIAHLKTFLKMYDNKQEFIQTYINAYSNWLKYQSEINNTNDEDENHKNKLENIKYELIETTSALNNAINTFKEYVNEHFIENEADVTDSVKQFRNIKNLIYDLDNETIKFTPYEITKVTIKDFTNYSIVSNIVKEIYKVYPTRKYLNYDFHIRSFEDIILVLITLLPSKYIYCKDINVNGKKMKIYYKKFIKPTFNKALSIYKTLISFSEIDYNNAKNTKAFIDANNSIIELLFSIKNYFESNQIPLL